MGSASQRRFVDWEEKFVSHDRGSRVVHYYLKDRHGHQCLAVIGTERSLRHMVYVVCDDFLPLAGLDKFITSAFKWRARREVVDWLSAFLTKARSPEAALSAGSPYGLHSSTDADSSFSHEGADGLESGQEECRSRHFDNEPRKQCSVSKGDVVWVGSSWSCRKRLRHFNSFQRNGITISVQNFVYVMTEEKDRHVAYVEDLFEDKKLRKKLRVRWFHKTSELDCRIPPPAPPIREVFYTTFQQDLSVECVDGVATVLSPEHLEACLATLPADSTAQALMCYREFDGEGIKTVSIQDVKGYWRQPILAIAGLAVSRVDSPQYDQGSEDFEMDEEEAADPTRLIRRGPRTARCSRRRTGLGSKVIIRSPGDAAGDRAGTSGEAYRSRSGDPHGSGERNQGGSVSGDSPGSGERNQSTSYDVGLSRFDIGHHIEVLSEDSGLRGKWFKATVLEILSSGLIKVRYDDLFSCENGEGNVEEWKSTGKVARPCKLGIRISGRPCIRPCPPEPTSEVRFNEGEIVDAWWDDGWWEGILRGKGCDGLLYVFIPGERETAIVESNKVRVSKEWVNGTWTAIPSCPDVVMLLGLSIGKRNMEQEVTARETRQCRASSRDLEAGQTLTEERCQSPVRRVKIASIAAVEQSYTLHDCNRSTKEFGVAVKEDILTSMKGEQEEQISSSLSAAPRSPRSGGAVTPVRLVFRQLEQDPQADGISVELNQNQVIASNVVSKGITASSGIPLKWKAGRKRHRQGDLMPSRVERIAAHSVTEVKDCSTAAVKHEVSSDGDDAESVPVDDAENLPRWKNGDGEDVVKHKRQRKGNDSSLKALHGTPMGSSLFIGPLPIANLVMSR